MEPINNAIDVPLDVHCFFFSIVAGCTTGGVDPVVGGYTSP